MAFSPDGKVLVSVTEDGSSGVVRLWDTAGGKELCRHAGHGERLLALAFSPDSKLVASGAGFLGEEDNFVHAWEAATGRLIRRFEDHHSGIGGLGFSPDGLTAASGGGDSTILLWDITGRRPHPALPQIGGGQGGGPLTAPELDVCWTALANEDAAKAYDAVWTLVAAPEQATPFLREHLPPLPHPDAKKIAGLIADLDSDDFMVRQKATQELSNLGDAIAAALNRVLDGKPTLDVRRRVQQLLDRMRDWTAERLRDHRAIQALQHIGTKQSKQVLQTIAEGAPESRRTEAAKAALRLLSQ